MQTQSDIGLWRIACYVQRISLVDAQFEVDHDARRAGQRVHAWVLGVQTNLPDLIGRHVCYHPGADETWIDGLGQPVHRAAWAIVWPRWVIAAPLDARPIIVTTRGT